MIVRLVVHTGSVIVAVVRVDRFRLAVCGLPGTRKRHRDVGPVDPDADSAVGGNEPEQLAPDRLGDHRPAGLVVGRQQPGRKVDSGLVEPIPLVLSAVGIGVVGRPEQSGPEQLGERVRLRRTVGGHQGMASSSQDRASPANTRSAGRSRVRAGPSAGRTASAMRIAIGLGGTAAVAAPIRSRSGNGHPAKDPPVSTLPACLCRAKNPSDRASPSPRYARPGLSRGPDPHREA